MRLHFSLSSAGNSSQTSRLRVANIPLTNLTTSTILRVHTIVSLIGRVEMSTHPRPLKHLPTRPRPQDHLRLIFFTNARQIQILVSQDDAKIVTSDTPLQPLCTIQDFKSPFNQSKETCFDLDCSVLSNCFPVINNAIHESTRNHYYYRLGDY